VSEVGPCPCQLRAPARSSSLRAHLPAGHPPICLPACPSALLPACLPAPPCLPSLPPDCSPSTRWPTLWRSLRAAWSSSATTPACCRASATTVRFAAALYCCPALCCKFLYCWCYALLLCWCAVLVWFLRACSCQSSRIVLSHTAPACMPARSTRAASLRCAVPVPTQLTLPASLRPTRLPPCPRPAALQSKPRCGLWRMGRCIPGMAILRTTRTS
jgi:hypothetical protein